MAWGVPKIGAAVTAASGNIALTEPAGIAQDDLMVACIAYRSNAAFTLPAGWGLVATQQSSGDTDATNGIASGVMAYIVRGASAPALTFNRTLGDVAFGRIIAYSGVDTSDPYDTGVANTFATSTTDPDTGTGIVAAVAGELWVVMVACGDTLTTSLFRRSSFTSSGATDTTTAPTDLTWIERADSGTGTGADTALAIADAVFTIAGGSSATLIVATVSAAARHVMIAGAFKPAPAAAAAFPPPIRTYLQAVSRAATY